MTKSKHKVHESKRCTTKSPNNVFCKFIVNALKKNIKITQPNKTQTYSFKFMQANSRTHSHTQTHLGLNWSWGGEADVVEATQLLIRDLREVFKPADKNRESQWDKKELKVI